MATGAQTQLKQLIDLRHRAGELNLFARNKSQSQLAGNVKTNFRGRGIDFEEIRQYQAGDDIRSIDWRVTARTGEAHTKLYQEERERPVLVAVDQRQTMAFGSQRCFKSVQAAEVASLLSWATLAKNDRVGGLVFNDTQHKDIRPARSKSSVLELLNSVHQFNQQALDALMQSHASTQTSGDNFYPNSNSSALQQINQVIIELRRIAKPGSAVFIISDFIGLNDEGVKHLHLLKKHCDVNAIFISDPMEAELPRQGGSQFTDGRQRQQFNIGDQQLLKAFADRFKQRLAQLNHQLSTHRIPTMAISTHEDAMTILRNQYQSKAQRSKAGRHKSATLSSTAQYQNNRAGDRG